MKPITETHVFQPQPDSLFVAQLTNSPSSGSPNDDSLIKLPSAARTGPSAAGPVLPSDQDMVRLKKELNFLLWTPDVVPIDGFLFTVVPNRVRQQVKVNIQCRAHTVIVGELFLRRGFKVTTRGGR